MMKKWKRLFLAIIIIIAAAAASWFTYATHERRLLLLQINNLIQIIPVDSATGRTFSWQAEEGDRDFSLEYRKSGATLTATATPSTTTVKAYRAQEIPQTIYSVYLENLTPDTEYEYRLVTKNKGTDWKTFKTTPAKLDHFKILIFGDSQAADYTVWGRTASEAWTKNPDAAFFINMGDIVDNGQDNYQWREWFKNARPLLDAIPFAPVLGNHEAYSIDWKEAKPETFPALFAVPENGPVGQKRLAYSFDYGNVHFVALNSDYQEIHEWYPTMMEDETAWLEADLAKASAAGQRIIILMHRIMWNYRASGTYDINGEHFGPLFDKYHASIVFLAHIHSYSRTRPRIDNRDAAGGTVYITTGRTGEKFWSGSIHKDFDETFYNPTDMTMYITMDVEPQDFKINAYKVDGTLIDSAVIPTTK